MNESHRHGPQPPQGTGHYSADGREWYDAAGQRWLPVMDGEDTLVIELEDVGAPSWAPDVLVPVLSHANPHSWFVGHALSADPRWPTYQITSAPFSRVHGVFDDVLPREAWPAGMAEALEELRGRLDAEGWHLVGHGGRDWTYRYVRPRVAWPSENHEADGRKLPDPPRDTARAWPGVEIGRRNQPQRRRRGADHPRLLPTTWGRSARHPGLRPVCATSSDGDHESRHVAP